MQKAKLGLSEEERRLVSDPGIILTKNAVIAKVYDLFGKMAGEFMTVDLPDEARTVMPKISKGENYKGLPYVMLDYPRLFTSEHVLAIRTHFWWGKYFSVTMHLKGRYWEMYRERCVAAYEELAKSGYVLALGDDEWEHELEEPFYRPISSFTPLAFAKAIEAMPFLKIGKRLSLDGEGIVDTYRKMALLIG